MKRQIHVILLCVAVLVIACAPAFAYDIEAEGIVTSADWTRVTPGTVILGTPVTGLDYASSGGALSVIDNNQSQKMDPHNPLNVEDLFYRTKAAGLLGGSATAVFRMKTTGDYPFSPLASVDNGFDRNIVLGFSDAAHSFRKCIGFAVRPDCAAITNTTATSAYPPGISGIIPVDNTIWHTWTIVGTGFTGAGGTANVYLDGVQVITNQFVNLSTDSALLDGGLGGVYVDLLAVGSAMAGPNRDGTGSWLFDRVAYKAGADSTWQPWGPEPGQITGVVSSLTDPSTKIANANVLLSGGRSTTSGADGSYTFSAVSPNPGYWISVSADSYLPKKYSNIDVPFSPAVTQNLQLVSLGTPSATVYDTFTTERPLGESLGTTEDAQHLPWLDDGEAALYKAFVLEGLLTLDSGDNGSITSGHGPSIGGGFLPANIDLSVDIASITKGPGEPGNWVGVAYRQTNPNTYDGLHGQDPNAAGYLVFCPYDGKTVSLWRNGVIASAATNINWTVSHKLRVVAYGDHHEVLLDGRRLISATDSAKMTGGYVGLLRYDARGVYDNLQVMALPDGSSIGSITGTVYDAVTPSIKLAGAPVIHSDGRSMVTDAQGRYSFTLNVIDDQQITVKLAGYLDKTVTASSLFIGTNTVDIPMTPDPYYKSSIGLAKSGGIGESVSLYGQYVTAQWSGTSMCIEEANRSAGIMVKLPAVDSTLASKIGREIGLQGTLQVDSATGEKYVQLGSWYVLGTGSIEPVFATSKSLATNVGLDMTGLYVKAIGKVTWVDAASRRFKISDGGADVEVWVDSSVPILVWPALNDWIEVDGIASLDGTTPENAVRAIKPWNGDTNYLGGSWTSSAPNNPGIEGTWNPYDPGCGTFPTATYWGTCIYSGAAVTAAQGTDSPHGGTSFAKFTSAEPYNTLGLFGRLFQLPGPPPPGWYEFSCWVRGIDVSDVGGSSYWSDWNNPSWTLYVPSGTYGWKRIQTTFYSPPGQANMNLGLNVVNTCTELSVDDVMIRPAKGTFTWTSAP